MYQADKPRQNNNLYNTVSLFKKFSYLCTIFYIANLNDFIKTKPMIKKNLGIFLFAGLLSLFASCENESNSPTLGKGSFNVSLSTNTEVVPVLRSTVGAQSVAPSVEDFQLTLTSENGEFSRKWSSINNINPEETYNIGNYSLKAEYGSIEDEGFKTPYFVGETAFTIRDHETTPVEVLCALGHVKFTLNYTDAFKGYFSNYEATVRSSNGKNVIITQSETRDAYLRPGDISLQLELTKPNGVSATFAPAKIKDAKAREHYIVTLDISENLGEVNLTIVFDEATETQPITINVSEEAMIAPAPYIVLDGITNGGNLEIKECSTPENELLNATITARGGLAGCTLTTQSTYLQSKGFPEVIELTDLTEAQTNIFEALGFEIRGFDKNRKELAIVNFATLAPSLLIAGNGDDTHTFSLTATDKNGKVGEPVSFTIKSLPLTLTMNEVADVTLGSKSIDIPVTFDGSDISRLKVLRKNGNIAQNVSYTVKSNEGNNYVLNANLDVENKSQTLYLSYDGLKNTAEQVVDIIVPDYTIIFPEANIWHNRATFIVKAADAAHQSAIEKYISFYQKEGDSWKTFTPEVTSKGYKISGLSASRTYEFKSSCLADASDMQGNSATSITTESQLTLPNANFDAWTQWFSQSVNKGGRYGKIAGWTQETQTVTSSNPDGWATVNSKTVPTSPKTKNTWYMVPSTLPTAGINGNAAMLRSVAWDNNGSTPPEGLWGNIVNEGLDYLDAPSIANRSAGKMFLGSYSYNHSNGSEVYNEGISFVSRPSKLSGFYKYTAKGNDSYGIVTITVEHRTSSGQVITLATATKGLTPASSFVAFEVPLNYTNEDYKATHLRVMFASSNHASTNQATETQNVVTSNNKSQAISTGSELCIDNLSLIY